MKITSYVSRDTVGDVVRCNDCGELMIVPIGSDVCLNCGADGCMEWLDGNHQEAAPGQFEENGWNVVYKQKYDGYVCFDGIAYPIMEIRVNEIDNQDVVASTTELSDALMEHIDKNDGLFDVAHCLDEQIHFYVNPEEIKLSKQQLTKLV